MFFKYVRRYVLRTVAQNLSKVSQMHPETRQNESYGLQGPFKPLPALREHVFGRKLKTSQNISTNSRSTAPAAAMSETAYPPELHTFTKDCFFEKQIQAWSIHGHRGWPQRAGPGPCLGRWGPRPWARALGPGPAGARPSVAMY